MEVTVRVEIKENGKLFALKEVLREPDFLEMKRMFGADIPDTICKSAKNIYRRLRLNHRISSKSL